MDSSQQTGGVVVDTVMLEATLAHLVRRERVFHAGRSQLRPEHLSQPGEAGYQHIWAATIEYYEEYQRLPSQEVFAAEVTPRLHGDHTLDEAAFQDAMELLSWMWSDRWTSDGDFNDEAAIRWIQHILIDREIRVELTDRVQMAAQVGMPIANLPNLLSSLSERYQAIESLQTSTVLETVPVSWASSQRDLVPTGIPMIDDRLNGGNEPGDVNVLLGPTGVGKTMTGMQILTSGAQLTHMQVQRGGTPKMHVFVSYEDDLRAMRVRGICVAAEIDKTRLERMVDYSELSTMGDLQTYEQTRFASLLRQRQPVLGERERLEQAMVWMNQYIRYGDFSGSREFGPSRGNGGLAEVRTVLEQIRQEAGYPIGTVVIDWAGMACRRHLRAQGKDIDRGLPLELMDYVDRVHNQITAPFDCVGWVLHQLKGQANGRPSATQLHHSDAEWCSSFAVNAWFAFVLGNKDQRTNTALFGCTKTRRGEGMNSVICRIDGAFGRLVQADDLYRIDPVGRRIISRSEAAAVGASGAQSRPSAGRESLNVDAGSDI